MRKLRSNHLTLRLTGLASQMRMPQLRKEGERRTDHMQGSSKRIGLCRSLLNLAVTIPLLAIAQDANRSATQPISGLNVYTLENVCSTGSQYILYPGAGYRSFIEKQFIHESFDRLLRAIAKLPAAAEVRYGCNPGTDQLASSEQIKGRISALQAACIKANVALIREP
jgi:hypothetical protein